MGLSGVRRNIEDQKGLLRRVVEDSNDDWRDAEERRINERENENIYWQQQASSKHIQLTKLSELEQ